MNTATLSAAPVTDLNHRISPLATPPVTKTTVTDRAPHKTSLPPTPSANRKKQVQRILVTGFALVAFTATIKTAHTWWTVGRFLEHTEDAYVGGDVTVLSSKVSGIISEVVVQDNQQVRAGDLLLKLDDRDFRAALAKAEAAVAMQQASLASLEASGHLQAAVIKQAEAEISSTEAEISRTHEDQIRYQQLMDGAAISVQSFQQADAAYKQAVAAGQKAKAALTAAMRGLDVNAAQKQQAQAALDQAKAERDISKLNLSYTEVRAPIDGIVGNRSAQTGAYASVGSQLVSLVPSSGLWIDANFKESQLTHIQPGSPATVKVDSIHGKVFKGHVASVAPATGATFSILPPENATGNFTKIVQRVTVRVVVDDATLPGQLRPGLSVFAEVDGRSAGKETL